jgi:hypothetical protein
MTPCPFCDDTGEVITHLAPGRVPVKAWCSCTTILFLGDDE